ncbi:MAG: hypothetical protein AAF203_00930 [Pseudomonadota bacterium]
MENKTDAIVASTSKQALYLWAGLSLSLTLFFVQSQLVFVKANPLPSSQLEWVLSVLGFLTFLMGYFFFDKYTGLRKKQILKMPFEDRKQSVLIAFVFQFILFETLGLYGVLVSVLTQNTWKAIPYVVSAYLGFIIAFPKKQKITPFFRQG